MSEELAARLMARIAVPPMPFAPDTYTAGRMDQFTEMITQLRALPEVDKEQALADAKARIGRLAAPNGSYGEAEWGFLRGVTAALAALTQPQTERCPEDCDGFGRLIGDSDGPCPACSGLESDGGGAATAAGAADADLEAAARRLARYSDRADDGIAYLTDTGIKDNAGALAETLEQLKDALPPGPYAKAFRERVCPVPEFPSIRETAHEAIIEGGCCIQCGLPNNSETVLFHSCQAGAPADPTCPNTGHKFSHCDCDLGIEKEES